MRDTILAQLLRVQTAGEHTCKVGLKRLTLLNSEKVEVR
jgi:hypothetical protein